MNLEQFKRYWVIGSVSYTVLLSVLIALLIGASVSETYKVVYYENELRYLPSLSMQRGSTITEVKLPVTINHAKAGERIVLRGAYETKQQDSLMVNVQDATLSIFVDDRLLVVKGDPNTYPRFQKTPSPDLALVMLPSVDSAKNLRFEYTVQQDMDTLVLRDIYLGENSILFEHLVSQNIVAFAIGVMLLFGGIIIISVTLLVMRRIKQANSLIWLGLACFLAGLQGFCQNDLAIYLITMPNLLYAASFVGTLFFPIPFLRYTELMLNPTLKTPLRVSYALLGGVLMLLLLMHLLGIVPFSGHQPAMAIIMILTLNVFMFFVLYEVFVNNNQQARNHTIPGLILFACTLASGLMPFLFGIDLDGVFFQTGVLIFALWNTVFGWQYIRSLIDEAERSAQLALEVSAMNRSLDMQRSLYQNLTQSTEEVRALRHDLRHQLSAIRGYLSKGNIDGAIGYIGAISENIPEISDKLLCDNFAVNAVAVHYMSKALKGNIQTDVKLVVPDDLGQVSDHDMSIIVGNLFENAIEACSYVEENKRFIRMYCKTIKNRLTLVVDNSFDGNYKESDGVFYSRKRDGKGIGLSSVRTVVERYSGSMKCETANGVFMTSVHVRL